MYVLNSCCPTVSESVNVGKNPAGMALARGPGVGIHRKQRRKYSFSCGRLHLK